MEQLIVGNPKRTVFLPPDKAGQVRRASARGNLRKQQEKAGAELAAGWKADFEARVQARVAAEGGGGDAGLGGL